METQREVENLQDNATGLAESGRSGKRRERAEELAAMQF